MPAPTTTVRGVTTAEHERAPADESTTPSAVDATVNATAEFAADATDAPPAKAAREPSDHSPAESVIDPSIGPNPTPLPLPGDDIKRRNRLPARTVTYWRIRAGLFGAVLVIVALLAALYLGWPAPALRWTLFGAAAAYLLAGTTVVPVIRRRIFWYAVDEQEIEIERGFFVVSHTVVPMTRVQHLKTEHGPLADRFRVAALHIHTAAGTVSLHALDATEAAELRGRIGLLANLADDV